MGFLWRRRSSLLKIVILLSAVWFTIAFLIYSEDRRTSNVAIPHSLELKYNNEINEFEDNSINNNNNNKFLTNNKNYLNNLNNINHKNESVVNNVILNSKDRDTSFVNNNKNNFNSNNVNNDNIDKNKRLNNHSRKDEETIKSGAPDESGEFEYFSIRLHIYIFFFFYFFNIIFLVKVQK